MTDASAIQAIGMIIAGLICIFLYLEGKKSSSKAWKIAASIAVIMGAPGTIHMLYVMYGNLF